MADLFSLETTADIGAGAAGPRLGTGLDTGVLRRNTILEIEFLNYQ